MRHRLAILMLLLLLAMLPVMNVLAAPAPEPYAILDIGPPPKWTSAEEHCKKEIFLLTNHGSSILRVGLGPDVGELPSVIRLKGHVLSWLTNNIRVTPAEGGRILRLTFRAGNRTEQVVILNTVLRAYFRLVVDSQIKGLEEVLHIKENCVAQLEWRIQSGQRPSRVDTYREGIDNLRFNRIPRLQAKIAELKQVAVIKWAR